MTTTVIINRAGGEVSILHVMQGGINSALEKWKEVHIGEYVSHRIAKSSDIPKDRTFRNAWESADKSIVVNLDKARAQIRAKRNKSLETLDTLAIAEARKPNGNLLAIDAEARRLRDLPESEDFKADSLDALKRSLEQAGLSLE